MNIATIGYEGSTPDDFLVTLLQAKITTLVDVRELPLSRRKGFSKTALSSALEEAGIEYIHLRGLGDPPEGRAAARAGNRAKFLKIFSAHMKTDEAKTDLRKLSVLASTQSICLMCFERNPRDCHRAIVAEEISAIVTRRVRHLGVRKGIAGNDKDRAVPNFSPCQGAAAA